MAQNSHVHGSGDLWIERVERPTNLNRPVLRVVVNGPDKSIWGTSFDPLVASARTVRGFAFMLQCEAQEMMFSWDDQFDKARVCKQRAGRQVHSRLIGTKRLQMQV
jgi:hypothetical protein